ncbi:GAF domain-like [Nostoc flagelliforme CCNUN1]|uniref:GAF domain-like n=1 Tax=Nostoc flagelliforme CCNUN1 TaxID=2038116 RepID=A0A2K8T4U0_9NOSO|nr:GAF domain-like [Nostoc flagelliforme CCNUN1]
MTISLFSGDAGRSLLIRRGMDSYSEVSRRQEADKINNPVGLNKRQGSREQGARGIEKNWDVALRHCSVTTPPVALASRISALICVPLRAKERVLGAIAIGTPKPDSYKAEHLKLVSIFASQSAIAIDKDLLYEQSTQAAVQAKAQTQKLQQALQLNKS